MQIPDHHPRVAHYDPYWWHDSHLGILKADRQRYRYIDRDCQFSAGDINAPRRAQRPQPYIKHWRDRRKDGFTHYVPPGKRVRRRFTGPFDLDRLSPAQLQTLRRGLTGRTRYRTAHADMIDCRNHGLIMCLELKDERTAHPVLMQDLWADKVSTGCQVIVMTLQDLHPGPDGKGALRRLKAAKQAGFPTALLPRGHKPANWDTEWAPWVDAVWGHWS